MWEKIAEHITQVTGEQFKITDCQSVSGGCINQGYRLTGDKRNYFVKTNKAIDIAMFEAEAKGLQLMWSTQTIKVPKPIACGTTGNTAYLVLEWLEVNSVGGKNMWELMGQQLAAMHKWQPSKSTPITSFGWEINNTIGSTPQINTWTANWVKFWQEHRIGFQLQLGRRKGGNFPLADQLLEKIPELLAHHEPQPSLVHGDLWGGNAAVTNSGEPVIFDPATYFADREVDLAMTELFGGFPTAFYRGYNDFWPLSAGYEERKILYNLYHVLNHFNLFGGSYESQANGMIRRLID